MQKLSSERADRACRGYAAPLRRSSNQFPRETDQEAAKTQGRFLPQNRSSVSSFASSSSYVLVSSRETFICETRPLEVPPNVIQAPVSVEITPTQPIRKAPLGPRKRSLPRPPAARAPIQTRSRTAAALHSDLPLPSEETTDVFINPHFEEPSSPIVPVTVEGSSSSREPDSEECLAGFPEPKQRSNDQMVIYVDSFPGVKNIKNPWNIFDSYTVPPSAFATPQPAAPKPAPRVDSPPKKRRLSSRKAHRRAEWFTDPSRPKLDTIPEAPSLEVENEALCSLLLGAIGGAQAQNATSCRSRKTKPHARITPIVSAYYPGYNAKFLPVENIPWKMYDHLQYFVAVPAPTPEGDLLIDTEQNMLEVIAAGKKNNVSISLSIGGWTGSRSFSFLVGDQKNRTTFVGTIERAVKKYDWEYPNFQGIGCNAINKNDSENFLAFLKVLRAKLGPKFRLSAAVSMKGFMSADGKTYLTDVSEFAKVLNFFTIMAYDVYGSSFSKLAGPNSPLFSTCSEPTQKFSVAQAIKQWTSTGVPARQLLLGIPSYGYGYTLSSNKIVPSQFSGKAGVTSQLFQPHADTVPAGGKTAGEATGADICGTPNVAGGQWLFKELSETGKLSKNQKEGLNGYERHYDNCTHTPFNPSTKNLISYDDSFSLKEKASYALEHGLGGVEMFDATGDTADSQLLKSVRKALLPRKKNSQHGLRVL
ncbi:hypothetical protein PSHT_05066 [Puccinia striiformis]|uniref:GH18 domain-containing protein n=1 Tax=Puccinia striiformis TaxID=27350 RepID=A0A2S4WBG1_9BASI|nr:hypothetical protein PSHT_05066 [Puccinia striiformis]